MLTPHGVEHERRGGACAVALLAGQLHLADGRFVQDDPSPPMRVADATVSATNAEPKRVLHEVPAPLLSRSVRGASLDNHRRTLTVCRGLASARELPETVRFRHQPLGIRCLLRGRSELDWKSDLSACSQSRFVARRTSASPTKSSEYPTAAVFCMDELVVDTELGGTTE